MCSPDNTIMLLMAIFERDFRMLKNSLGSYRIGYSSLLLNVILVRFTRVRVKTHSRSIRMIKGRRRFVPVTLYRSFRRGYTRRQLAPHYSIIIPPLLECARFRSLTNRLPVTIGGIFGGRSSRVKLKRVQLEIGLGRIAIGN